MERYEITVEAEYFVTNGEDFEDWDWEIIGTYTVEAEDIFEAKEKAIQLAIPDDPHHGSEYRYIARIGDEYIQRLRESLRKYYDDVYYEEQPHMFPSIADEQYNDTSDEFCVNCGEEDCELTMTDIGWLCNDCLGELGYDKERKSRLDHAELTEEDEEMIYYADTRKSLDITVLGTHLDQIDGHIFAGRYMGGDIIIALYLYGDRYEAEVLREQPDGSMESIEIINGDMGNFGYPDDLADKIRPILDRIGKHKPSKSLSKHYANAKKSLRKSRYDDFRYWGRTHFDTCPAWASDKRVLFDETVDGYCMHMESDTPMTEYDFNRITHELESGGSFTNIQISEPQQGNYKQYLYILTADDGMDGGYESMLDELVEISGTPYYDGITLGQAIEIYGIDKEGNPDDTRAFARCPKLKGLCGPSFPNHGFVARYDTWESYNLLSTSTRKSFRSLLAEQRNKRGRQIW